MPELITSPAASSLGAISGEARRHLVIVFSDLSSSTALSSRMEPEDYVALLDGLRARVSEIVMRHGGTILRIDGDGFIFVFGIPEIQEHAARHAIETCLDLHREIAGLAPDNPVRLHSGIHAGIVLLRPGDVSRGRYEILGEPTNIAARLCDLAKADEILVSQDALGAERYHFDISEPRSVSLIPGQPALHVHTIKGLKSQPPGPSLRLSTEASPFVGRRAELAWLNQSLSKPGEPAAIKIVEAEAGLGKTRLVSEFLRQANANGLDIHVARCDPYMGTPALQPVAELTASFLRLARQRELPGEIVSQILERVEPVAAGLPVPLSEDSLIALAGDLADILASLTDEGQTLLFIDDWHWADSASRNLISKLVSLPLRGVTLLLATRAPDTFLGDLVPADRLTLPPLTDGDSAQMIAALAPRLDPFLVRRIIDHAGGNPLFTEEICHSADLGDPAFRPDDRDTWLRTFVSQRFMRLPDRLATILKVAAVMGSVVPVDLLKEATEGGASQADFEQLGEADFLFPAEVDGQLRFKHGLTREAIYELISLSERRQLHERVAEAVQRRAMSEDAPEADAQLAYHLLNCGKLSAAITHALRAGHSALKQSALDRAQFFFQIGLQAIAQLGLYDPRLKEALIYYGRASIVDPSWEQTEVLERGVDVATRYQDIESIAWGRYWLASILYGLGEPKRALAQFSLSQRAARETGNQGLLDQIATSLGQVHAAACEYDDALRYLNSAIAKKTKNRLPGTPSVSLAYALSCKAFAFGDMGEFERAFGLFDEALGVMGRTDHEVCLSILGHRSAVHLWKGEFNQTLEISGNVLHMSDQMHSRYHYAMSHVLMGAADYYLGVGLPALQKIEAATRWMIAGSSQQYISLAWGYLADGYARLGDRDGARRYAARAIQRARKGDRLGETMALRALAMTSQAISRTPARSLYIERARNSALRRGSRRDLELSVLLEARLAGRNEEAATEALREMGIDAHRFFPD